jgi:glycosyltransferase involved in cell wall biosynthesis
MTATSAHTLRLLVVTPRFLPETGGVETHVYEVGRRLVGAGVAVTVLTTDRTRTLPPTGEVEGIRVVRVPAHPRRWDLYLAPRVPSAVARLGGDVVHVQSYHSLVSPLAMLGALRARIPYVVTFHSGGHSSPLRRRVRAPQAALLKPLLERAARLIAVSAFEAETFSDRLGIARDRFEIVPNGAELPDAGDVAPVPGLVVSVGRLERYKGHHRVIEALPELLRGVPEARLRIVGSGPYERELHRLAQACGVADRVQIGALAATDRVGMASVLKSASVVALLSDYESHGLAALEAASTGRPVLVSASTALQELVDAGTATGIAPDSSRGAIAAALERELRHPTPRRPAALPSWDRCAEQLLSLYRQIA